MEKFKKMKKWTKVLLIVLIAIIFTSILGLIGILNSTMISIFNLILAIIILFYMGMNEGKKAKKKGFLAGIKIGVMVCLILFLLGLLFFKQKINLPSIIYYSILILSSVFGSVIGINRQKNDV